MLRSQNILKPFHPKSAEWVGYVFRIDGQRIYIAGDTDATKEAKAVKCEVALVPIGGTYTMDARKAAELVNAIRPNVAIPVHYGSIVDRTIVATVDDEGLPVTAAIDMMDSDENGLYFFTAKGKNFYDRLIKRGYLALTAMKGEDTMSSVAVSVRGKVRELGYEKIPELFEKNPYMHEIYPTEDSMHALTVFQIYEGTGEYFDLSKKPIERASFAFGGEEKKEQGYFITDACIAATA